ncbi:hypothetical protein [Moraxella lacunata]|uniref:hypothetical protein n=1 Tax=Moraxella lacunata TaxID=477 RepID=UPI003EE1C391
MCPQIPRHQNQGEQGRADEKNSRHPVDGGIFKILGVVFGSHGVFLCCLFWCTIIHEFIKDVNAHAQKFIKNEHLLSHKK